MPQTKVVQQSDSSCSAEKNAFEIKILNKF